MKSWWTAGLLIGLLACGSGDEIARVGNRSISKAEFQAYLALKRIPESDKERRAVALASFLKREALADAVEQQKLVDAQAINAEVREFRKDALINRYIDAFLASKVSDAAVENYYTAHAQEYEERKVHVAHLLFRASRGMAESERAAQRTRAQEAATKLHAGGDFAKLAEELSEDKVSGRRGGDLGWIKEGGIHLAFSDKAFALKPGEISEPVETPFGFHVIRLVEGPSLVKRPLEAVRGDIRYKLRETAKRSESERLMSLLKIERSSSEAALDKTADSSSADKSSKKP